MSTNLHNLFDHLTWDDVNNGSSEETIELPRELCDLVDSGLKASFGQTFAHDALLGDALTQVRGSLDSALKRHGKLLEEAIAYSFARHTSRFEVMEQVSVTLSKESIALINANPSKSLEKLNIPTSGTRGKRIVVDLVVFDHETGDLHIISVKRGNGTQGGSAARNARRDLSAAGLAVRQIMLGDGFPVQNLKKILIDWYGRSGIVAREKISRDCVDSYFGIPITPFVDAMSDYLAKGIAERVLPHLQQAVVTLNPVPHHDLKGSPIGTSTETRQHSHLSQPPVHSDCARRHSLGECLSVLSNRRQGRQMRQVRA